MRLKILSVSLLILFLFSPLPTTSTILQNDMLESIGAFAFANLPQLTNMWVYRFLKAIVHVTYFIQHACVFSLCYGTRRAAHPNSSGVDLAGCRRQNTSKTKCEWKPDNVIFLCFPQLHLWECCLGEDWIICFLQSPRAHWDVSITDRIMAVVKPCNYKTSHLYW